MQGYWEGIRVLFLIALMQTLAFQTYAADCPARANLQRVRGQLGKKCSHTKNRFNCLDVIKVTDGDTISVNIPGIHAYFGDDTFVRLHGLDTPESRPASVKCLPTQRDDALIDQQEYQKCLEAEKLRECELDAAKEASELVQKIVCEDSDRVDVEMTTDASGNLYREKYGRVLGNLYVTQFNGRSTEVVDVKDMLLGEKLAFEYDGGTKKGRNWCNKRLITDPKLQASYVKANFCSSRKCTEKTLQRRCYHRQGYSAQKDCYLERIDDNIKVWFRSCAGKSGVDRKECYQDKANDYLGFCRQYDSRSLNQMCRKDLSKPIENFCQGLSAKAMEDCLSAI